MKLLAKNYQRIVVKIGTSLLTDSGTVDRLTAEIADLIKPAKSKSSAGSKQKRELVLVSSGAIGCGMSLLGLKNRPKKLSHLQAAASLGQNELMKLYCNRFSAYGIKCSQVLLTWDDFDTRARYLSAKNTLDVLLKWGSLPIINENDAVSVDEIKFGDNDRLSALVANLIGADILIILSDVEGLLNRKTSELVKVVAKITPAIEKLATCSNKATSVGGMKTKLSAARMAMKSQIPCLIVNGKKDNILHSALADPWSSGTLFLPEKVGITARKKWLSFCARPKGKISVDDGAKNALLDGKSLLSVGVLSLDGHFSRGDIVDITNSRGICFARGKVNFSAQDLGNIKGKQKMKEVIHRDDLVIGDQ